MMPNALFLDINSSTQSLQSAQTCLVKGALLAIPLAALVSYNFLQYYFYHNIYIDFHASKKTSTVHFIIEKYITNLLNYLQATLYYLYATFV